MPVKLKICGINTVAAADAVLKAGAEFGGLVFHVASPRNLTLGTAVALAARMRGRLKLVALVVDEGDERLAVIADEMKPDFFQLHGKETPARAAHIRGRFGIPLIKAIHLAAPEDIARAAAFDGVAEMLLFDTPPAKGATRPGGHGAAFDWRMLKDQALSQPWFLAGGLTPDNVARAIAASDARMVDVSSGVESAPGVKSDGRIAAFAAAVRGTVPV